MKKCINKLPLWMILLWVSVVSCVQEDSSLSELQGTIRFGGIRLEFEPMGSPGGRVTGFSPWVHVFPESADLVFINKTTGKEYVLKYNPNDLSGPYTIMLAYGEYEYYSIVDGGTFSAFLPFEASGEFFLDSPSLEITLDAKTEYGLVTVNNQYVEKAWVSDGEKESKLKLHQESNYWFLYVKGGTATTLKIKESFKGTSIIRELKIVAYKHYNFVLKLLDGAASITDLILSPFDLEEEEILIGSDSKFSEENGTIKCPEATPGDKGSVNDKIYEAVDRALLIQRRDEGADLSCVCTSLVTDMSYMFSSTVFNQPIGNWDVSNVTDMNHMFSQTSFNQPIGNWDVGNVKNMNAMFNSAASFNQPIGNWDVGKVTNMSGMFAGATYFNQPIGNWNVSNVTNIDFMFADADNFNQPIENWDVGNVKYMNGMFNSAASFNQPIGTWDVSNVTNMQVMFAQADKFNQPIENWNVSNVTDTGAMFAEAVNFNQPIGNWDVSNVTEMSYMFFRARNFNQDLSSWCVRNFQSEPRVFSLESDLSEANKPVWGTCPD